MRPKSILDLKFSKIVHMRESHFSWSFYFCYSLQSWFKDLINWWVNAWIHFLKTKQKTNNFHLFKWERSCEDDDLIMVGCNVARRRSDLSLLCFIMVLYRYCCCYSSLVIIPEQSVTSWTQCAAAVFVKWKFTANWQRRWNCLSDLL